MLVVPVGVVAEFPFLLFGHYFGHFGHFSDSFLKNKNDLQILTKLLFFFILNEYLYNVQKKISSRLSQHLLRLLIAHTECPPNVQKRKQGLRRTLP